MITRSQPRKFNKIALTKTYVKHLMHKYGITATKRFGQNFLFDQAIISEIINASNVKGKDVVEIGPGLGTLTLPLLNQAESVTAYEIDRDMIKVLKGEIDSSRFKLIENDFLEASFNWNKPRMIIANIPYNITTKIVFKIIQNASYFNIAILMVQKEFGERMVAHAGTKNYGKLSVAMQSIATIKPIIVVKNTSFMPVPKVASMVVKITLKEPYNKSYFDFLLTCFARQRKMLVNNLKTRFNKDLITSTITNLGFKNNVRPQELKPEQFKAMWQMLKSRQEHL